MKKIIFFILITTLFVNKQYGQIIDLYKKINNTLQVKDTQVRVQYYKTIDSSIFSKIDSFFVLIRNEYPKYSLDSNFFISVGLFFDENNLPKVSLYYNMGNAYYRKFSNCQNRYLNTAYAFFFYKEKLVLFSIYNSPQKKHRITYSEESCMLVKNLIYENFSASEKALISKPPKLITVVAEGKPWHIYNLK